MISADIDEKLQFSHSTLSALRRIEARLLLLPPIFHSLIQDINMLKAFNDALRAVGSIPESDHCATQEVLQNYATMAAAYSQNAVFLRDKIRGTAQLLADTLNLKHQKIAQSISENTLALTDAAVKDSATIRVITVATLLYLPATFVAVGPHFPNNHVPRRLTLADAVRNAIFWSGLGGWIYGSLVPLVDLLCIGSPLHGGYLWVLEVDGQKTEEESVP